MADRVRLVIPAGERQRHQIECHWTGPTAPDGTGPSLSLGSLDWSAIVLNERIVDMQVSLLLHPKEEGGTAGTEVLEKKASGRNFNGRFAPEKDPKYADVEASDSMHIIVFEFDNSSSWFTEKEVELVTIRTPAQMRTGLLPLPSLVPLGPLPRSGQGEASPLTTQALPDLRVPPADTETCIPAMDKDAFRFVSQLDALLAVAESNCPQDVGLPGTEALVARVLELRSHCNKVLHDILPEKAKIISPDDNINQPIDNETLPDRDCEEQN